MKIRRFNEAWDDEFSNANAEIEIRTHLKINIITEDVKIIRSDSEYLIFEASMSNGDVIKKDFDFGKEKEREFGSLFKSVRYTTDEEDRKHHVDLIVNNHRIDVKGIKMRSSKDKKLDPTIHWVELQSVEGKHGWLYGKAHYLAFEQLTNWIIVSRQKLKEFIIENVINNEDNIRTDGKPRVLNSHYIKQEYKLYRKKDFGHKSGSQSRRYSGLSLSITIYLFMLLGHEITIVNFDSFNQSYTFCFVILYLIILYYKYEQHMCP